MRFTEKQKARFWSKVQKTDDCWEWTAATDKDGYGKVRIRNTDLRAHRVSYMLSGRALSPGHKVRHMCNNPPCVNPDHLRRGTSQQNSNDAVRQGRSLRGTRNPRSKLTYLQVLAIRALGLSGTYYVDIARQFGMSIAQVHRVVRRVSYSWMDDNGVDVLTGERMI